MDRAGGAESGRTEPQADNGRIDFLMEKMVEISEKLARVSEKLDYIVDNQTRIVLDRLEKITDKLDRVTRKTDQLYDSMLRLLDYVYKHANNQGGGNSLLDWLFKLIQILILALLALVGVKLYTTP